MRQVYTESQRRKFVEDYEKSSLSVRDYCQSRNISTCLYYHWKNPAQISGLSMTLPNGIRIGLDGMSMEDLSRLLVSMGRHA
jgi:hypothetical protein